MYRILLFRDLRKGVYNFKHTLGTGHAFRPFVKTEGQEIQRIVQLCHVADKGDQDTQFQISVMEEHETAQRPYKQVG